MLIRAARGFVLDIDGCLVLRDASGETAGRTLPGAADLISELRQRELPFLCCTNASGKVPADYAASLRTMGLPIADEELITPAVVAAEHLAAAMPDARVIVIGGHGVTAPIRDQGITIVPPEPGTHADAVLVGPAPELSASALQVAAEAVRDGAAFFVTSHVPLIPKGSGNVPSVSAAFGAAIAHVAGAAPTVLGKPSPLVMESVCRRMRLAPGEIVIVGDDPALEIELGHRSGSPTVLTLTGITHVSDVGRLPPEQRPDVVVRDTAELCDLLRLPAA